MKKVVLSAIFASLAASSLLASTATEDAKVGAGEVEKKGFLATEECIKKGLFKDCKLDTTATSPFALYVHSEGVMYKLEPTSIPLHELDEGIGKNNVTVIGTLEKGNLIKMRAYKSPPPEGKSFFKGCL
jgi:hypothetical protein